MPIEGFTRRARRLHIDFHTPAFLPEVTEAFDPEAAVALFKRAHANAVNFFAKCHYGHSYYFTKAGNRHPRLRHDLLAELIPVAHREDIAVGVYYSLAVDDLACRANPDWAMVDAEGRPYSGRFGQPCLTGPYVDELVLPQVRELLEGYDLDGLFFDFTRPPYCACEYCRRRFEAEFGQPLPKDADDPLWADYCAWRRHIGVQFETRVRRLIDRIRPGVHLAGNWSYSTRQPEPVPVDGVTFLTMDPPDTELMTVNASFECRYLTTLGVPYDMITTRFHEGWGDWTFRPAALLKQEAAAMLANGALVNIGDQFYPEGVGDPATYDLIGEVFRFVEEREQYCLHTESVPQIAVLHSAWTHFWRTGPNVHAGGALDPIRGAHKALTESGFHFSLCNEEVLLERLGEYCAVVLPDQQCLSDQMAAALSDYVNGGGVLLATYMTGWRDQRGRPRDWPALVDLLGITCQGASTYTTAYLSPSEESLWRDIPRSPICVKGPSVHCWLHGAEQIGALVHPRTEQTERRFVSWGQPPAGQDSGFAGITVNRVGEGAAAFIAAEVFAPYWQREYPPLRHLVANLLDYCLGERPLQVQAPPAVEVSLRRRGDDLFLHLVNGYAEKRVAGKPATEAVPVVLEVPVRLRHGSAVREVTLLPEGTPLPYQDADGWLSFTVPSLHLHAIVRIR